MVLFSTERLRVRGFEDPLDRENFFVVNSDPEVMQYIRQPRTREEADAFLEEIVANTHPGIVTGRWAVEDKFTGTFLGTFVIIPIEGTSDIQLGYALLKPFWGKGYATELTKGGLKYYFSKTGARQIWAITEAPNTASQHVLLKAGFRFQNDAEEKGKKILRFLYKKYGWPQERGEMPV